MWEPCRAKIVPAEDSSFLFFLKKCSHYLPKTHSKSTVHNLQLQLPYQSSQMKEINLYKNEPFQEFGAWWNHSNSSVKLLKVFVRMLLNQKLKQLTFSKILWHVNDMLHWLCQRVARMKEREGVPLKNELVWIGSAYQRYQLLKIFSKWFFFSFWKRCLEVKHDTDRYWQYIVYYCLSRISIGSPLNTLNHLNKTVCVKIRLPKAFKTLKSNRICLYYLLPSLKLTAREWMVGRLSRFLLGRLGLSSGVYWSNHRPPDPKSR